MNKTQHVPDSITGLHLSLVPCGAMSTQIWTFPLHGASHWIQTSPMACMHMQPSAQYRQNIVNLVDYAVYQLCMKQLSTRALGLRWKPNGYIPTTISPFTFSTCPFINPARRPFVCANIRLAVCLSARSAIAVFLLFTYFKECQCLFHLSWRDWPHW